MGFSNFLSGALDHGWAQLMHGFENGFFNAFFKYFSYLADKGILIFIVAFALMLFKKTRYIGANMFVCVAVALVMSFIAKELIDRPRPFADLTSDYYNWWVAAGKCSASNTGSFPSGHATVAFALAVSMIMTLDKRYGWTGILFGLAIIVARTYLMVHYLTDVLGGAAFGVIGAVIGFFIVKLIFGFMEKKKDKKFFNFCLEADLANLFRKKEDKTEE